MRIAITQPNYLPWLGYFDLLDVVELWVSLDNAQFSKGSFIPRNRIKFSDEEWKWLTVRLKSVKNETLINQAVLDKSNRWWEEHLNKIKAYYAKSEYYEEVLNFLEQIIVPMPNEKYLSEYNTRIVTQLCSFIDIDIEVVFASDIITYLNGTAEEKVVKLCKKLNASSFYNFKTGVEEGLYSPATFSDNGITLYKHDYDHPTYRQLGSVFMPYMSIVDLLFNEHPNALEIIRKGSKWIKMN